MLIFLINAVIAASIFSLIWEDTSAVHIATVGCLLICVAVVNYIDGHHSCALPVVNYIDSYIKTD